MNSLAHTTDSSIPSSFDAIDMSVLSDIQKDFYEKLHEAGETIISSPEEGAFIMNFPVSMISVLQGQLIMYSKKNPHSGAQEHIVSYIPTGEQRKVTQSLSFSKIVLEQHPHIFNMKDLKHCFFHCAYLLYMEQFQKLIQEMQKVTHKELTQVLE